jgi:type VI protein secretion system component VasF
MLNIAAERFERRLTHEVSALRVDLTRELHEGWSGVHREIATGRADLFKWSFLFWVGQVVAVASLLAFMLHGRP